MDWGVFKNRLPRRIAGYTRIWRRLRNEELRDFYSWLNIIRTRRSQMVRINELVARIGERRIFVQGFGGKTGRGEYLGRCGLRWEGNIKTNI